MILVIAEHRDNKLKSITNEMLVFAQRLGKQANQPVTVAVLGTDTSTLAAELKTRQVAKVLRVEGPSLAEYEPTAYAAALRPLIERHKPYLVLAGHTTQGFDFLPRLSASFRRPLIAGCVDFSAADGVLELTRQVFNAKMNLKVRLKGEPTYFATVAPGAFVADDLEMGSGAEEELETAAAITAGAARKVLERVEAQKGQADLSSAGIIVSGGRGLKQKENFQIIFELADALGASVGASRPVVDSEWLPREYQVGSSGQTVSPKLYFAVGISGAIQHLVGMQTARCIVAINKDADAPIFKIAHYGIVDDLFKVVPAITRIVRDLKAQS